MPSAKEVEKEKGFYLGEIQVSHLVITEKLFLYLGETKNELQVTKKENEELKTEE